MAPPRNLRRRRALTDSAIEILGTSGTHELSHRAVDERAGLPAGTTSNYFSTRDDLLENPAALYAGLHWAADTWLGARIHVLMPYTDRLREFAEWYRQLWAESLGKRLDRRGQQVHLGPTPVAAVGATDQHSQVQLFIEGPFDKAITFVAVDDLGTRLVVLLLGDPHLLEGVGLCRPRAQCKHERSNSHPHPMVAIRSHHPNSTKRNATNNVPWGALW